jgi:hypothetical protein
MKYLSGLFFGFLLFCSGAYAQGWEEVGTGSNALQANNGILALCYDNGTLYAGGSFDDASGNTYVAKWNGTAWEPLGTGANALNGDAVTAPICVDKKHNVYTCGKRNPLNKSCVMKWDGTAWGELGTGSTALNPNGQILAICTDGDGNVYAGGWFHDGAENFYVAKWNGTSWSQLGTGGNALNANSNINTLAADSHGNIYAGGDFTRPGNVYVAKWDGMTWHRLGTDSDLGGVAINTLYVDATDNIYAGGRFKNTVGHPYVAKWDGSTWSELGTGSNALNAEPISSIDAITGDKAGNLYAAGTGIKQTAGKWCVKRWDGVSWSEVGTGSTSLNGNAQVIALCTDTSGALYAGGYFSNGVTSGDGYKYVARFSSPAAIKDFPGMVGILAWPNPAHDVLFVQGAGRDEAYYLCDIAGVVKQVVNNKSAGVVQTIDISALSTGVYFLRSQNSIPYIFHKN